MPSRIDRDFAAVLAYCKRWGVTVHLATHPQDVGRLASFASLYTGPVRGVIDWRDRSIWFGNEPPSKETDACALLHELSHCLDTVPPDKSREVSSFMLAFEWHSARRLRLAGWREWMRDYGVDGFVEWSDISTRERGRLIAASLQDAVRRGILDERGRPTFRREARAQVAGARGHHSVMTPCSREDHRREAGRG